MKERRPTPGEDFEAAIRSSLPRGIYVRRLRTPTAMGFVVPQLIALVASLCAALGREVPEWVTKAGRFRFTPKAGFDLLVTAQAAVNPYRLAVGAPPLAMEITVRPSIFHAWELKSEAGASIAFDRVDDDQVKALMEAAEVGHLAFVLIEFRAVAEVWAIPIQAWQEARARATRKSLPLEDARRIGAQIHADAGRGVSNCYWRVDEFISSCGAMLPGRRVKPAKPPAPVPPAAQIPL